MSDPICAKCGKSIAPGEPLVLSMQHQHYPSSGNSGYRMVTLCLDCRPVKTFAKIVTGSWETADPLRRTCQFCRRVVLDYWGRNHPGAAENRRWSVCSEQCRQRCRVAQRSRLRQQRRDTKPSSVCEVCGGAFAAVRSDARTCSPACRQRARRERLRSVTDNEPVPAGTAPASVTVPTE